MPEQRRMPERRRRGGNGRAALSSARDGDIQCGRAL